LRATPLAAALEELFLLEQISFVLAAHGESKISPARLEKEEILDPPVNIWKFWICPKTLLFLR
jgi:hypothetical protein